MQTKITRISRCLAVSALCALSAPSAYAQPVGQWDFNSGTLAGTVGGPLEYAGGVGGATQLATQFGTATSFGLPTIGGTDVAVIRVPKAADDSMGFVMPVAAAADNGTLVNTYTLIFDILFPSDSHSKWRALLEADNRTISADAEFFVNTGNGIGISGNYSGSIQSNTWYRIGVVMNATNQTISKYINGVLVGTQPLGNLDDRFALSPGGTALLFSDDDGETEVGYVNSIQLRNVALTSGEMLALGGPIAAGIQQTVPPVPSQLLSTTPSGAFASRTTTLGGVIDAGSTTIQDSSINLRLNGTLVANPTITRDGAKITVLSGAQNLTPGNKYTNVLSYTDNLAGAKSFTNVFTAAVFFEDFNSIALGPNVEETDRK